MTSVIIACGYTITPIQLLIQLNYDDYDPNLDSNGWINLHV